MKFPWNVVSANDFIYHTSGSSLIPWVPGRETPGEAHSAEGGVSDLVQNVLEVPLSHLGPRHKHGYIVNVCGARVIMIDQHPSSEDQRTRASVVPVCGPRRRAPLLGRLRNPCWDDTSDSRGSVYRLSQGLNPLIVLKHVSLWAGLD